MSSNKKNFSTHKTSRPLATLQHLRFVFLNSQAVGNLGWSKINISNNYWYSNKNDSFAFIITRRLNLSTLYNIKSFNITLVIMYYVMMMSLITRRNRRGTQWDPYGIPVSPLKTLEMYPEAVFLFLLCPVFGEVLNKENVLE